MRRRRDFADHDLERSDPGASPYAYQVTKDANNKLPSRKFGQAYGIFYIDDFGPEWKEYHRFLKLDERKKGALGACLVCHSLGAGYSGGLFTEYSAGKLPPGKLITSIFNRTHWMPPDPDEKTWEKYYSGSVKTVIECNKNIASCDWEDLH